VNAQSQQAISREISVFNFGSAAARYEAISQELSVFNGARPNLTTIQQPLSREITVFNFGEPATRPEAISREISILVSTNPFPDLRTVLSSAPASAIAGSIVTLVYAVGNVGATNAVAPWTNQFLIATDAIGTGALSLTRTLVTNSLVSGGSVTLTQ